MERDRAHAMRRFRDVGDVKMEENGGGLIDVVGNGGLDVLTERQVRAEETKINKILLLLLYICYVFKILNFF